MCPYDDEIRYIAKQIMEKFAPIDIILFGSCAKGRVTSVSDIDICVIMDTDNKRQTVMDILLVIESERDVDIVLYTPSEWLKYKDHQETFTGVINKTGVSLLG